MSCIPGGGEDGWDQSLTFITNPSLGYSIFVVKGDLPDCEADQILRMIRVEQMQRPRLIGEEAALRDQRYHRLYPTYPPTPSGILLYIGPDRGRAGM